MSNSTTDLSHGSLVSQAEGKGSKEMCESGTFLIFVLIPWGRHPDPRSPGFPYRTAYIQCWPLRDLGHLRLRWSHETVPLCI